MDFISACRQFIEIDSVSGQGNSEIANCAADLCSMAGLNVEIQNESHQGIMHSNIIARTSQEASEDEILLQAHLDTTAPGAYGFWRRTEHNPFNPTIYDGKLYGLGAAGAKLDFLSKLKAIESLRGKSLKRPVVLTGTYGSETGMGGVVKMLRKKKIKARKAFIGGPSSLRLEYAAKGTATVELMIPFSKQELIFRRVHDQKESSSSQNKIFQSRANNSENEKSGARVFPENSIVDLLKYLESLPKTIGILNIDGGVSKSTVPNSASLEFDLSEPIEDSMISKLRSIWSKIEQLENEFTKHRDSDFDPPFPTINFGLIRTREEYVLILGTCSIPPTVSSEVYESWMDEIRSVCSEIDGTFQISEYLQPFKTSLNDEIVTVSTSEMKKLGLDQKPVGSALSNEANILSRFGVDCVVFGAGEKRHASRTFDEFVEIESLEKSVKFYERILERFCL